MPRSDHYNTKQKDLILNIIKQEEKDFTIKDIHSKLKDETGLTTIYRFMDKLIEDGLVDKHIGKDNKTYYNYLEKCDNKNHFYLKCESCGKIVHIDCDCIEDLSNHITNKHKFKLNRKHFIINGTCGDCNEG
ncbi:MAG: transcriptional repressor [Bacilli bacterium]|nr:transcriptional repressor [Bacilli bacterium]